MREYEANFVELLKTDYEPETMTKTISNMVNSFSMSTKEMIQAIAAAETAKKRMDGISWYWIRTIGTLFKNPYAYDARNEQAYKICNKLLLTETDNVIFKQTKDFDPETSDYYHEPRFKCNNPYEVAMLFTREHRTLQQSFTGFVFAYLTDTCPEFAELTEKAGYERLGHLMMI